MENAFNTGIVFGHNAIMAERGRGQHYIKIDDDCFIMTPNWLEIFSNVLAKREVGSVVGRRPSFWLDAPGRKGYFENYVIPEEINGVWVEKMEGNGCVGCWWCMKGEVLDEIGPFNEASSNDDQDWQVRASYLGYESMYVPDVAIQQMGEEPCIHPQSKANYAITAQNRGIQQMYLDSYKRGKIRLGSKFKGYENCDDMYRTLSEKNMDWFRRFKNSDCNLDLTGRIS
jgi:GT2 family glycosyltransferase